MLVYVWEGGVVSVLLILIAIRQGPTVLAVSVDCWGCLNIFYSLARIFFLPSYLWETTHCLKEPLNPNIQSTKMELKNLCNQ